MTVPFQRSGNSTLDQVQRRTSEELRRLSSRKASLIRIVAAGITVPSGGTIDVDLPADVEGWFVVNNRSGFVVAETARSASRLTLTANGGPVTCDIAVF